MAWLSVISDVNVDFDIRDYLISYHIISWLMDHVDKDDDFISYGSLMESVVNHNFLLWIFNQFLTRDYHSILDLSFWILDPVDFAWRLEIGGNGYLSTLYRISDHVR